MTGKELKELVKGTGVSIAELARKMGKTTQNISYIFNAKSVKMEKIYRTLSGCRRNAVRKRKGC